MVLRLKCSTQNYLCQINYTSLIFSSHWNKNDNEQRCSARWVSAFPLKHLELNEYQLYYTLCMKRRQLFRAVKKYFYFNIKFQRKTLRNCYVHLPLWLLFWGCGSEPRLQRLSRAPAGSVSEKDLVHLCHTGSFCGKQKPLHHQMCFCQEARAHEQVLASSPFLLEPNTEAAEGWSVY